VAGDNVQMFILGSLTQGEANGYQLVARAKKWGVDTWAGFKTGSIYNALRTLQKRGLVKRLGTEQRGGYAPATVFGITEEGRSRLVELLHEAAAEFSAVDPFDLVTAFFGVVPVEERRELIDAHIVGIRRRVDRLETKYAEMEERVAQGAPADWALAALEKGRRFARAATESCESLSERCEQWEPPEPLSRQRRPDETDPAPDVTPQPGSRPAHETQATGGTRAGS
jgi:DNA-binding PadR family transcriptional regulator